MKIIIYPSKLLKSLFFHFPQLLLSVMGQDGKATCSGNISHLLGLKISPLPWQHQTCVYNLGSGSVGGTGSASRLRAHLLGCRILGLCKTDVPVAKTCALKSERPGLEHLGQNLLEFVRLLALGKLYYICKMKIVLYFIKWSQELQ